MKLHWEAIGPVNAEPVLLIMGLSLGSRAWDKLPAQLARRFRVITFDNRGTGRSVKRGVAFRMAQLADDAAQVLGEAGERSAHVFGISMGGMIAQELALRHPERVRSLALGCTFACWRTAKRPTLGTIFDLVMLNSGLGRSPRRIGRLLASPQFDAQRVAQWLRGADRTTPRYVIAQMLAIRGHACEDRLKEIRVPTLVMTGTDDRLVPPENSDVLARLIPNARLVKFEGAGHVFPIEREADVVRALTEHFSQSTVRGHDASTG